MNLLDKSIVELRREFHRIPEVGWLEFETTIKIIDYLKALGYEVEYGKKVHGQERMGLPSQDKIDSHLESLNLQASYDISEIIQGYTGAVARLDTKSPGPTIGLRFDIDALNISESTDQAHLPIKEGFASKKALSMHACGHDGHIAIGLALAKWLMEHKDSLKGKYVLIFQPAEEGVRGAKSMVEAGVVDGLDYVIGGHIGQGQGGNTLGVGSGGFLATSKLDVEFIGVPSHAGASPEEGRNALLAAASATLNLHSLTQFSSGMARLNVGTLRAGTSRNIIASQALMEIETRGENEDINKLLSQRVYQVIQGSSQVFDVDYKIKLVGGALAYSPKNTSFIDCIAGALVDKGYKVNKYPRLGGSEDFSYMMVEVENQGGQALHFNFGTEITSRPHHFSFDFNETILDFSKKALIDTIELLISN